MQSGNLDTLLRKRHLGKYKYVFKHGMLMFGIPLGIIILVVSSMKNEGLDLFNNWASILSCIIVGVIYGSLIGIIHGHISWSLNEKQIKKYEDGMSN